MKSKRTLTSGLASLSALMLLLVAASVPVASAVSPNSARAQQAVTVQSDDTTTEELPLQDRVKAAKDKAKVSVEKARENKKAQSQEKRQMVCEKRKVAINNKIAAFTKAADTQLAQLEKVATRLTDYQSANNVTVANFADLTAAAEAKKQAATDAVEALKAVAVDIDCTDPEVAVTLTTVKNAAQTTRLALREYRASLHDMLVALAQASDGEEDTTTTGDDTTTEPSEQPSDTVTDGGAQ